MTLRTRIAAVASLSVALAVLAAAVGAYVAVRADLRGQVDSSLRQRAQALAAPPPQGPPAAGSAGPSPGSAAGSAGPPPRSAAGSAGPPPGSAASAPAPGGPPPEGAGDGDAVRGFPRAVRPPPYGAAAGYVQFIAPRGEVSVPVGQGSATRIAPSARDLRVAARGDGEALSDRTVRGTRLRVLTLGVGARGAVLVALPLAEVDRELSRLELLLVAIGLAGIALAAALGILVARTALAPIARFTKRTERVTGDLDPSQRLEVSGHDELARLAESFNATLDALARSVAVQRQLIADAGHELRTPIASLRANIQVLQEVGRLPPEERENLRRDVVQELEELTALIGDVIEFARGAGAGATHDEVPLDALVRAAVERARRRASDRAAGFAGGRAADFAEGRAADRVDDISFEADLEPTLIRGDAPGIDRAISNLLENARKWSPPGGCVEVRLHAGELSVRDHGPGFAERDLPFVFDRFYRADEARKLPGSGLGLAIVRQAAEAHGGYARAENAPGGGALLRVHFGAPLAQEMAAPVDQ